MSERKNLTVFSLTAGIIGLVNEDGDIVYYRQRGITNLDIATRQELIRLGLLYRTWYNFEELPRDIKIHYEDEEVLGQACAVYPYKQAMELMK